MNATEPHYLSQYWRRSMASPGPTSCPLGWALYFGENRLLITTEVHCTWWPMFAEVCFVMITQTVLISCNQTSGSVFVHSVVAVAGRVSTEVDAVPQNGGLVQNCSNSIANALQSCKKPSKIPEHMDEFSTHWKSRGKEKHSEDIVFSCDFIKSFLCFLVFFLLHM